MRRIEMICGTRIDLRLAKMTDALPERNWLPAYYFDIVLQGTDIVAGYCDARIGHNENTYYGGNIGYSVEPQFRGNGYAAEAVEL